MKLPASVGRNRSERSILCLWEAATGKQVRLARAEALEGSCFAFSPDNSLLAIGGKGRRDVWGKLESKDQRIDLVELVTGEVVLRLEGHPGETYCCFSPDGRLLASGGEDGLVRV